MIRIGFFHADHEVIASNIEKASVQVAPPHPLLHISPLTSTPARRLVEEGGDWDRRNRLKAYQGIHNLSIRNFQLGGQLLLDTISTFTATELIDYDDFVGLCILAGVMTLDRKDLKKKVSITAFSSVEERTDGALVICRSSTRQKSSHCFLPCPLSKTTLTLYTSANTPPSSAHSVSLRFAPLESATHLTNLRDSSNCRRTPPHTFPPPCRSHEILRPRNAH